MRKAGEKMRWATKNEIKFFGKFVIHEKRSEKSLVNLQIFRPKKTMRMQKNKWKKPKDKLQQRATPFVSDKNGVENN